MSGLADVVPRHDESAGYQWEPSDAQIAAAWGIDPAQVVRFDTNTSPRTPPSLVAWIGAAASPPAAPLNEYPDTTYAALTAAISANIGAASSRVVVGAGADEVLDIAARTFLPPGGRAVVATPSYGMYPVITRQRHAALVEVPRGSALDGFPLDADRLAQAATGADLLWLCDPNNPTGTVEAPGVLRALLDRLAAGPGGGPVVVVDEAYREFAGPSLVDEVGRFPRLVVVRTLSKAYGLAGVRVGYGVAQEPLLARLSAVRPPGSIATLSAAIGAAALREGAFARSNVAAIGLERERFRSALERVGWHVEPSVTNFLLLDAGGPGEAGAAAARLLRRGFVPRRFGAGPLRGHLRITVRTADQDDRLVAALAEGTT
ncbi:MAG TPA: histidinol-phosphate transaminase [Candidatus Acidoferrales bacterium]|nr:histidinol-phosphate transaminase [Candidatus Acidoferrales bacterium]